MRLWRESAGQKEPCLGRLKRRTGLNSIQGRKWEAEGWEPQSTHLSGAGAENSFPVV